MRNVIWNEPKCWYEVRFEARYFVNVFKGKIIRNTYEEAYAVAEKIKGLVNRPTSHSIWWLSVNWEVDEQGYPSKYLGTFKMTEEQRLEL